MTATLTDTEALVATGFATPPPAVVRATTGGKPFFRVREASWFAE